MIRIGTSTRRLGSARTAGRERGLRAAGTPLCSAPPPEALHGLPGGRKLERADEADFVLELDAEFLERPPACFGHQRDGVGGPALARVLDEVRVPRGDLRSADPVAPEPAGFEHPPGRELVLRVLEDAAEGALVRRLRGLALSLDLGDRRLDLVRGTGLEPELGARDDLARAQSGAPVLEPELGGRAPLGPSAETTSARSRIPFQSPP